MKLNHINLTVTEVEEASKFLLKYFGMRNMGEIKAWAPYAEESESYARAVDHPGQNLQRCLVALQVDLTGSGESESSRYSERLKPSEGGQDQDHSCICPWDCEAKNNIAYTPSDIAPKRIRVCILNLLPDGCNAFCHATPVAG
jgi:hypothetical protein